jgi:hypothetical protein
MLQDTNLHKLVTKEDPTHIHKLLGLFSLANYIYRYYLLLCYGSMFLQTPIDLALVGMHGLLSVSSLIFHIPKKRHASLPMIYPEFRLHSIAFGLRCIVCCFIDYYGGEYKLYYKMGACYGTMIVADTITKIYAEPGDTTMRAMPYADNTPPAAINRITRFHSHQQVSATIYMLLNMDSAFSPLFAIQFAAFLMTLVRKSIIKPNTWHLWYSWALMINIFVLNTMTLSQVALIFIGTQTFIQLRMTLRMNKYIAWSIIFAIHRFLDLQFIDDFIYADYVIRGLIVSYIIHKANETRALYM